MCTHKRGRRLNFFVVYNDINQISIRKNELVPMSIV